MMSKLQKNLRIIWAIAFKDILDAVKNKTTIGIFIGVGFIMLSSQAMTMFAKFDETPTAIVFDHGESVVLRDIIRSRELRISLKDSLEGMQIVVGQSPSPVLGLEIPANFDELFNEPDSIQIQGYYIHWLNPLERSNRASYFEEEFSRLTDHAIKIQINDHPVYPNPKDFGYSSMIITGIVLGVMTIGLVLVPLLLIDEKETHTMDALMVSPAKTYHLLLGKSLAGLFYSLIASLVVLIFSWYWVVHWWVLVIGIVLGALGAVAVGLFFGSIFDNPTTVNLWVGLFIAVFMLPVFIWTQIETKMPEIVREIFQWMPALAMSNLIGISFANQVNIQQVLLNIFALTAFFVLTLSLVSWSILRKNR